MESLPLIQLLSFIFFIQNESFQKEGKHYKLSERSLL